MTAGRAMGELIAIKVMGWRRMSWRDYHAFEKAHGRYQGTDDREDLTYGWHDAEGNMVNNRAEDCDDYYNPEEAWSPSTDIAAAWSVVERCIKTHHRVLVVGEDDGDGYICEIGHGGSERDVVAMGETAPLAICLAALQAVAG